MGDLLITGLRKIDSPLIADVRGKGLLIGVEIEAAHASARKVCEALLAHGILSKDTHDTVVRFAPPLVISAAEISDALKRIDAAFRMLSRNRTEKTLSEAAPELTA